MITVRISLLCLLGATTLFAQIERRLPPVGIEIPADVQAKTETRLAELRTVLRELGEHPAAADVDVLLKAVAFALKHREIYKPIQLALLDETLSRAEERMTALKNGKLNWNNDNLAVRGFYSGIDDSPQPYGLVIPKDLPVDRPAPLYVWLHGRGDKTTDIHFIMERLTKVGQISPPGAIVLHPFGRHCIGFKSAGEVDVLEAIAHVKANYNIDSDRVVLMGFSMGGAGAWHLGTHYTDQFAAVSPGAGFAETARYQKLSTEKINATPWYERKLWNLYDVPNYARNLFNVPMTCYSGEKDKQIQAARVMEEAFAEHGQKLDHIIGPGMGHKYDAASLETIMEKMDAAVKQGRDSNSSRLFLQTQTLRYPKMHWVRIDRLDQHWEDSTVDVEVDGDTVHMKTKNIRQLTLDPFPNASRLLVDGQSINVEGRSLVISRSDQWAVGPFKTGHELAGHTLAKKPGLQGPIDDAFLDRFIVVTPDGTRDSNSQLEKWQQAELDHLRDRWSALFRGTLPEKPANEVTAADIRDANLIVFGSKANNSMMLQLNEKQGLDVTAELARVLEPVAEEEARNGVQLHYAFSYIHPNPLNPAKYVVCNSGPTFREAHDRTNSLQNPKLPDWVIYEISQPPTAESAARVVRAGFFDEDWKIQTDFEHNAE